jgi:hypothetical protein
MQCERLIKLAKTWYLNVRDETMAPARMISFIEQHVANCDVCQKDPDIHDEIVKITQIILPEAKMPKAFRSSQEDGDDIDDDLEIDDTENLEEDDSEDLEEDLQEDDLEDETDLLDPDEL